jgi:hypothetical protein
MKEDADNGVVLPSGQGSEGGSGSGTIIVDGSGSTSSSSSSSSGSSGQTPQPLDFSSLVGLDGEIAVQMIKEADPELTRVSTVPKGSVVTMDHRMDRVRVFVNAKGLVATTPRRG